MSKEDVPPAEVETIAVAENDWNGCDVEQASQPFVGRWNQLISTTNWEKGRIIAQWRAALEASDAPPSEFSDDAWARRVGGVTGQHVGRLRRVYQRFGASAAKFNGLYWSHFQAAIEWADAEMWLEGAAQSDWSVSEMRTMRWQTLGANEATKPQPHEVVASETDEDFVASAPEPDASAPTAGRMSEVSSGPRHEGPDFGDDGTDVSSPQSLAGTSFADASYEDQGESLSPAVQPETIRPFENLPELPADLADAFDAFKLAIIRHKNDRWQQISRDGVLASLDALKQLALAPAAHETTI